MRRETARALTAWAAMLCLAGTVSAAAGEETSMEERCQREVVELHGFFEQWFNARLPNDDQGFARFADVIDSEFEIIGPDGRLTQHEPLIAGLRAAYGTRPGVSIEIRSPRAHKISDDLCLATYEEWQTNGERRVGWISSALMRRHEEAPNGVVWLRVHETYLRGGAPDE